MAEAGNSNVTHSDAMRGLRGWLICDGKAGMMVQLRGVADALGLDYDMKIVKPSGLARVLAPWGPTSSDGKMGDEGGLFAKPFPAVAIATGRASIPYLRKLRGLLGPSCYTVVLQDPKTGRDTADLIWVPAHDRRRDVHVITTLTSPHSFSQQRLAELRGSIPDAIATLPQPRVAVVLGGKNGIYKFTDADDDRLGRSLNSLKELGASFMITPSRRSHQRLVRTVDEATADAPRILWDGSGDNPYPSFLAHADMLIVTADSVNMTGEACSTGQPVYVFSPAGGSAKFQRFHDALKGHGATRELPDKFETLETWEYAPLNSAELIAQEICARWLQRKRVVPGLVQQENS
ncbi:MAG: mitochondrial fission ELM1 family protein [Pseudomonadota bacterium]